MGEYLFFCSYECENENRLLYFHAFVPSFNKLEETLRFVIIKNSFFNSGR